MKLLITETTNIFVRNERNKQQTICKYLICFYDNKQ
jgi:hypothetical protein